MEIASETDFIKERCRIDRMDKIALYAYCLANGQDEKVNTFEYIMLVTETSEDILALRRLAHVIHSCVQIVFESVP